MDERDENQPGNEEQGAAPEPKPAAKRGRKPAAKAETTRKPRRKAEPEGLIAEAAESIAEGERAVVSAARKAATSTRRASTRATKAVAAAPRATRRAASAGASSAGKALTGRTAATLGVAAAGLVAGIAVNLGRKAAVQAPSALAGDWFDAVKAEHKMALTLFDGLQKTADTDKGKRSTLLAQLKHALGKHAFMEENVLYPALRDHGDKEQADKLNHDHGYVKQYLYDLENLDKGSPEFLPKVAEFRAEIEEHIREEEQEIFPPLHAAMGDKNAKLTAQANKEAFKLA